ncbi:DNA repair protein RAD7 [Kwoniella heveanensis BCC8398]|uniref:DNA repair protein RAD7 n=1 Tax=Kwoniella heveanensis BCC8398 TaxID=1296120 RepID=A0A1B9GPL0_9TREE|nr:DNA repair protein RAD7 [Kwoniella heveanensis BCC8398]
MLTASQQVEATPSGRAPVRKRTRGASIDSDDLDADNIPEAGPSSPAPVAAAIQSTAVNGSGGVQPGPLKPVGEFMDCGQCTKRFTVTAYTKEHPSKPSTFLCVNCCYALGIDPFAKPRKTAVKKKASGKKEDRAKIIHYEERKGVLPLGDLCIQMIGKYIEDVEQLGDIGGINMDKVCKIICKGRRLTTETAPLFYAADRDSLEMYDCTNLNSDAFISMGKLCPNLISLHLHLCGQLSTEALSAWAKSLKSIKRLELYAPFLVRKEGWINFIKTAGKRLEGLLVTQSPRIDLEVVQTLAKSCPNLTELRLAEVGQLNVDCLAALRTLQKLKMLDLSSPGSTLSDEAIIGLLASSGKTIEILDLSDNPELTDLILPAIVKYCPRLHSLSLRNLVELTDEGVAAFFQSLKAQGHEGLTHIDFEKGHDLQDKALHALVDHSGKTVEKLSLLGWRGVTKETLNDLTRCSHLKEVDLGWCRDVTDFTIKDILDSCGKVQVIRVWGCNQLTDAVPRKKGVKVIGIETHTI